MKIWILAHTADWNKIDCKSIKFEGVLLPEKVEQPKSENCMAHKEVLLPSISHGAKKNNTKGRNFQKVKSGPQRTMEKEVPSICRVYLIKKIFPTSKMEGLNHMCPPEFQNCYGPVIAMYHRVFQMEVLFYLCCACYFIIYWNHVTKPIFLLGRKGMKKLKIKKKAQ